MALAQHLLNSPGQRSSAGLEPVRQATILGGERDELEAARPRGATISGGEGGRGTSREVAALFEGGRESRGGNAIHYYKTGLWSFTFIPATIRPGINKGFSPGSKI